MKLSSIYPHLGVFAWGGSFIGGIVSVFNLLQKGTIDLKNLQSSGIAIGIMIIIMFLLSLFMGRFAKESKRPKWLHLLFLLGISYVATLPFIFFSSFCYWSATICASIIISGALATRNISEEKKDSAQKQTTH